MDPPNNQMNSDTNGFDTNLFDSVNIENDELTLDDLAGIVNDLIARINNLINKRSIEE